jgi:hypothetical protein
VVHRARAPSRSSGSAPARIWSVPALVGRQACRLEGRGRCAETDGSYAASRLCVFGRGLRFALRLFSACNPRRSNLHQYSLVLFRCSLRQTPAFCRILAKPDCIIFHAHSVRCSNVPGCKPGTLGTIPVQINFADGTKAAIRRSRRASLGGVRAGDVWRSLRTIGGTPPNAFDLRKSFGVEQKQPPS